MRYLLLLALVGCQPTYSSDDYYIPPGDNTGCTDDSQCGGLVCARTDECLSASELRTVHVTWTVQGLPANNATCANSTDLEVEFYDENELAFGYAPVPCTAGLYTITKLPTRFYRVRMALIDTDGGGRADIDADGNATLDLPY